MTITKRMFNDFCSQVSVETLVEKLGIDTNEFQVTKQPWNGGLHFTVKRHSDPLLAYVSFKIAAHPYNFSIRFAITDMAWRNYPADYPTEFRASFYPAECEELFDGVIEQFKQRYRKPESRGNTKVFFDSTQFMWVWKRPTSDQFIEYEGAAYLKTTCNFGRPVNTGRGTTDMVFLSSEEYQAIVDGTAVDSPYIYYGGTLYKKGVIVLLYKNAVPFDVVHTVVFADEADQYEFVIVNGEKRYLNLRKNKNNLTSIPIHSYTTRIEALVPREKLFLKGKTDLYAKRPTKETPFLGFELEALVKGSQDMASSARKMKEYLPWLVMCKQDGSLSEGGFETVSIPATLDFWKESNLAEALDCMRAPPYSMRSFDHNNCGFHVHVSRSALSVLDVQKLERFLHNPDNREFVTKIAGRGGNTYQKYDDNVFKNRKPIISDVRSFGNSLIEGFKYYGSYEDVTRELSNFLRIYPDNKVEAFWNWCDNYCDHGYMSRVLRESSDWAEYVRGPYYTASNGFGTDPSAAAACVGYIRNNLSGRRDLSYFTDNTHEGVDAVIRLSDAVLKCLSLKSPKFARLVKTAFPDWDWENVEIYDPEEESAASDLSWKAGLRKSKAKAGRRYNKSACDTITSGPVGKEKSLGRYDVLNMRNSNTVEFRLFKGTMNPTSVFRYLEFVDALVRFVASTSASDDGVNYKTFVKWLMNDSFNVARYEHLVSFVVDNGFLERKFIRRKTLPQVVSADTIGVSAIKVVDAKGFGKRGEDQPLGVFNLTVTSSPQPETETPLSGEEAAQLYDEEDAYYDPEPDSYPDSYEEDGDYCGDPDCEMCNPNL